MIRGQFREDGALMFEVGLVTYDGEILTTDVLLDTGFTAGYLAVDKQDIEAFDWELSESDVMIATAQGQGRFDIYEGKIIIDNYQFTVPVQVGKNLPEIIIGVKWLKLFNLVVNYPNILTLEYKG